MFFQLQACFSATGDHFIPSSDFRQHVQGYVFTTRDQGLGYYKDAGIYGQLGRLEQGIDVKSNAEKRLGPSSERKVYHVLKPKLLSCIAAEELD